MALWALVVETKTKEHVIPVGPDESVAIRHLHQCKEHLGQTGVVTLADRLAVDAETLISLLVRRES